MAPTRGQSETQQAQTVTENDLIRYCSVQAVKQIRLASVSQDGKLHYLVYAKGSWGDKEECLLITFRKKPREWSSVDRFLRHAQDVYRFRGRIVLDIGEREN